MNVFEPIEVQRSCNGEPRCRWSDPMVSQQCLRWPEGFVPLADRENQCRSCFACLALTYSQGQLLAFDVTQCCLHSSFLEWVNLSIPGIGGMMLHGWAKGCVPREGPLSKIDRFSLSSLWQGVLAGFWHPAPPGMRARSRRPLDGLAEAGRLSDCARQMELIPFEQGSWATRWMVWTRPECAHRFLWNPKTRWLDTRSLLLWLRL